MNTWTGVAGTFMPPPPETRITLTAVNDHWVICGVRGVQTMTVTLPLEVDQESIDRAVRAVTHGLIEMAR